MTDENRKNSRKLFIAVIFFWIAMYVYIPYQTTYLKEIGTANNQIGIIVGAYGISQMLLRFPVGVMADRKNYHKRFILLGGAAAAAASVFRIFVGNDTGFFIGNIFSGLASAMWISFMVLYMSYYTEEKQHTATGKIVFANNIGMLAGFIISTLMYQIVGMKVICGFSVLAGLVCVMFAFTLKANDTTEKKEVEWKEQINLCRRKRLLLFSFLALVQQGVQAATAMSFSMQMVTNLGGSLKEVGIASIIYMLSAVVWARFSSSTRCEKFSVKIVIPVIFIVNALYLLLIPEAVKMEQIYLLQILPGMATGLLFSMLTAEAMKGVKVEVKSTAMGLYQTIYAVGMTILPMVGGKIAQNISMKFAYEMLALLCLIAAMIAVLGFHQIEKADKEK